MNLHVKCIVLEDHDKRGSMIIILEELILSTSS